jgi:hypothetical protein
MGLLSPSPLLQRRRGRALQPPDWGSMVQCAKFRFEELSPLAFSPTLRIQFGAREPHAKAAKDAKEMRAAGQEGS